MGASRASVPRFRRVQEPRPIQLTDDDITILHQVRRYRFMRTTDLYRLFPDRSTDKLSRRLARLYRAGYLDRPLSQIDSFRGEGSQPLVYGLDNAGAAYLAALDGVRATKDLRRRNRAFTRENLDHTLATTSFMVDVELACREREDVEFMGPEQILAREGGPSILPHWGVSLPWHGHCADVVIAPDAIFGLRVVRGDGPPLRSFYFVEVDRGSMTIAPSEQVRRSEAFLYRSSVLRKLLAYAVSHCERMHQEYFGIPAARVLFLTTRTSRAEEMIRSAREIVLPHLAVPTGLFLFGTPVANTDPLEDAFWSAAAELTQLLP